MKKIKQPEREETIVKFLFFPATVHCDRRVFLRQLYERSRKHCTNLAEDPIILTS